MRSQLHYLRRSLADYLRYGALPRRLASHALAALAKLRRTPLARLESLARAARVRPTVARLLRVKKALDASLDTISLDAGKTNNADLGKGIMLKPPVSAREKGVLYLTFEKQWLRLLRCRKVDEIAARFDVVLGPSTSPPPHVELLLMAKHWPGRLWVLPASLDDADLLRALSPKLAPVPLMASSWVDPYEFVPHLGRAKDYDLVMLARFDPDKRHWLLFDALRRLPRSYRVLLMGVLRGGRSEADLRDEARAFGAADRFDLLVRPTRAEVMSGLARSRASLVFSRQEGACIAVAESLFADTPVGLFENARIGSKAFINEQTGVLLRQKGLACQLAAFVERSDRFRPRDWAVANISCHVSRAVLNDVLRQAAATRGGEWTRDLLPIKKDLVPSYLSAHDEAAMQPWYEEFHRRYGLLLGQAARTGVPATRGGSER